MANPTIVGLAIESQDPSGKDINEAYYDLVVVSAGYGASCVPESLCVPLPLLKPEAVATLLKRGAFQYRERAVHDRVITEDVEELEEIRSKLLDIIGGEEAAIGLCQEYLGTTECVGTHLP